MSDDKEHQEVPFADAIGPFIQSCPGPDLAIKALRLMAYQDIAGIHGLEQPDDSRNRQRENHDGGGRALLTTLADVAKALSYSPAHLSRVARRRGYSISLAIRWVRFLHGYALRQKGMKGEVIARRLGLSDASVWSRSVKELTGRAPSQLPRIGLVDWVLEARRQVFIMPLRPRNDENADTYTPGAENVTN